MQPDVPHRLRYALVVACAAAVLWASLTEPGDVPPSTLPRLNATASGHLLSYAALARLVGYEQAAIDRRVLRDPGRDRRLRWRRALSGALPYRIVSPVDDLLNAVGATAEAITWRVLATTFIDSGA